MRIRLPAQVERTTVQAFVSLPRVVLRRIVGAPVRSPEGYELDPQVQALIWLMSKTRQPGLIDGGVENARRRLDRNGWLLDVHGVADVSANDRTLPGAAGSRRARVYTPKGLETAAAPALVFLHGGGFVLGSIESHDGLCRGLASRARVMVISVDYRLAPENPFPAAVDDAVAATRWVLDEAGSLGVDPDAVAVGGDSAGGCLAAVVAQTLRDAPRRPAFQLLMYPTTDATHGSASLQYFRDDLMLTERDILWFTDKYLPSPSMKTDPRASPLLASDLSGQPPALVLTAGFDPLRDEGRAYAERMSAAGVEVEHVCSEPSVHGFMSMAGVLREPARMFALAADRLTRALSPRKAVASAA
jgi:acetyl esterase